MKGWYLHGEIGGHACHLDDFRLLASLDSEHFQPLLGKVGRRDPTVVVVVVVVFNFILFFGTIDVGPFVFVGFVDVVLSFQCGFRVVTFLHWTQ